MHDQTIVAEFTHQAESFAASAPARDPRVLERLVRLADPQAGGRWLEVACGPGLLSRALAPHVGAVHGVDLTPAMVELARRDAAQAGLANVTFAIGDATALEHPAASFDGALARFAIHHLPVPCRLFGELARLVRPGGRIVLADHLLDADPLAAAWSQAIERLRDPSHWACLPISRLRELGRRAGLTLEHEEVLPLELDFDDWLARGSGASGGRRLLERALIERPDQAECFAVRERGGRRRLELRLWLAAWRR